MEERLQFLFVYSFVDEVLDHRSCGEALVDYWIDFPAYLYAKSLCHHRRKHSLMRTQAEHSDADVDHVDPVGDSQVLDRESVKDLQ